VSSCPSDTHASLVVQPLTRDISNSHNAKSGKGDSTMGKMMEKAGNMMHNKGMAEKGLEKREQAGLDDSRGNY